MGNRREGEGGSTYRGLRGMLLKLSLCPPVLNGKAEREFGAKEKKIALLLCQAKYTTAGSCPKDFGFLWERKGGNFTLGSGK